jgi:hypothetical protein
MEDETIPEMDISCNSIDSPDDQDNRYFPYLIQSMIQTGMTGTTYLWCIGPTGPTGPPYSSESILNQTGTECTGMSGPMGPLCSGTLGPMSLYPKHPMTFIHVYSTVEQKINAGELVFFDTHSILSGHCIHFPNSSDIWVWKLGFYYITISLFPVEAMQCSFLKNDADIEGGTFGTFNGLTELVGTFMIHITEDDLVVPVPPIFDQMGCKLSLVNNTIYTPFITLHGHSSSNYDKPQTTASVIVVCIG